MSTFMELAGQAIFGRIQRGGADFSKEPMTTNASEIGHLKPNFGKSDALCKKFH
jgi:hypothetical protein